MNPKTKYGILAPDESMMQAKRLYRQAKLAEREGDLDQAFHLNAQALTLDVTASQADWMMLNETPRTFRERRALYRLLSVQIDELARKAKAEESASIPNPDPKVFVYWGQGFDSAPAVVRACKIEADRLHRPGDIVYLDDSNLHDWITLPQWVHDIKAISMAAFADVLRFSLLAKHGGVWMDATCMPTRRLQEVYPQLVAGSGFFAFNKPGQNDGRMSNWFLASKPGNYVTIMCRDSLLLYWSLYDRVITYFFMHQMFRHMYRLDGRFHRLWDRTTRMPDNPRAMNRLLKSDYVETEFEKAMGGSFVHKLSYKFSLTASENSVIRKIESIAS